MDRGLRIEFGAAVYQPLQTGTGRISAELKLSLEGRRIQLEPVVEDAGLVRKGHAMVFRSNSSKTITAEMVEKLREERLSSLEYGQTILRVGRAGLMGGLMPTWIRTAKYFGNKKLAAGLRSWKASVCRPFPVIGLAMKFAKRSGGEAPLYRLATLQFAPKFHRLRECPIISSSIS